MNEKVDSVVAEINARFSKSAKRPLIQTADKTVSPYILRRPTSIASIDIALAGGFPAGGIAQIAGPEGAGKNAICNQVIKMVQRLYKNNANIAWVWTEMPYDKPFAHKFGVRVAMSERDIELYSMARKGSGLPSLTKKEKAPMMETVGNFLIIGAGSTAQRLQVVVELVGSNQFQLIIVDSIAALLTEARDDTDLDEEPQQSSEARLVTEFQKKLWGAYSCTDGDDTNWTTVMVTNQVKANRSLAKYKKAWTVGGAHALRHGKLIDIWVDKGDRIPLDREKPKIGKMMKWEIAKGKAGCHEGPTGELPFLFDTGFDVCTDVVNTSVRSGLLVQKGKYWHLLDEVGALSHKFTGKRGSVVDEVAADPDLFDHIYSTIMRKEKISCLHKL